MDFTARFKELRAEYGLSAIKLSKELEFSKNIVYAWEKGRAEPNFETLKKLADIFDVSVDYLIGRTDDFGNTMQSTNAETLSSDEQRLLRCYRALGDVERRAILTTAESLNNQKAQAVRKTN